MENLKPDKVYVQYRDFIRPCEPVYDRKYTITHSDVTGELFVFIGDDFAEDKVTEMRDEVRVEWEENCNGLILFGYVLIDGENVTGNAEIRNKIFYNEMDKALQALRHADRFLFETFPQLNNIKVYVKFISCNPEFNKIYDFGYIGDYTL